MPFWAYLSNIAAAWPAARQEALFAERIPGWPKGVEVYRDELPPRHRKSHSVENLTDRARMLRPTTRRRPAEWDTIYVASAACLAWEPADYMRCVAAAHARNAQLVSLDAGRSISPDASSAEMADALAEFMSRRRYAQTEPGRIGVAGGKAAGERRSADKKAAAMQIKDRWCLPTEDYPTNPLLASVKISRNTANLYLGKRPAAQRAHRLGLEQAERNRKRRKTP